MITAGWLVHEAHDVPAGVDWLSTEERATHDSLRFAKRREDWRLGRWTAKCAVSAALGVAPDRVSVRAAADGAPEPFVEGHPAPLSLSISHREGHGLAVVGPAGAAVGGDLEVVEPRSGAFVREWLSSEEQMLVGASEPEVRDRLICLLWSAKEAAAKVLREGLRIDVRAAVVTLDHAELGQGWRRSSVDLRSEGRRVDGWWRVDDRLIVTVAAAVPNGPPERWSSGPTSVGSDR